MVALQSITSLTVYGPASMVFGMAATCKITITLENEQIEEIHALVASGAATSVSGFVQHAVSVALHDSAGWRELLKEALVQTGGPLTRNERVRADKILSGQPQKRRSRKQNAA